MKQPTNQLSEVLYLLIEGKKTTLDLVKFGILNPSARISNLRAKGVNILCEKVNHVNKFSRKINYGLFILLNKKDARLIYTKIN
jgi:hypothetical protein